MQIAMRKWINAKVEEAQMLKEKQNGYKYAKWVISANNAFKAYWDVFCILLVIYVAIVVPFRLGFGMEDTGAFFAVRTIIDLIFVIDIVLSFFTEIEVEKTGRMINTHREIARNYFKGWFLLDLLTVFPFELFSSTEQKSYINANQSLRIVRITKLSKFVRLMRLTRLMKAVKKFDPN